MSRRSNVYVLYSDRPAGRRGTRTSNPSGWPVGKTAAQLIAEAEEKAAGRTFYRLRRHARPWLAAAGTAALAAAGWWADKLAGPLAVAVTAAALAAAGWLVWALAHTAIPSRLRGWSVACLTAGCLWLPPAAAAGPSWWAPASLVALTLALSARWWRSIRIPAPGSPPPPPEVNAGPAETIPSLWDAHVGSQTGPLPGSYLTGQTAIAHGEEYTCQLARGKQTLLTVLDNLPRVASGLDVPVQYLVPAPHPSDRPSLLTLRVVTSSPVAGNVAFTRPRWSDGLVDLGPYTDGEGEACWRLCTPGDGDGDGSAWSGAVFGSTGIGKSRLVENLVTSALSSGLVVPWFLDPQGGASSPALQEHADWCVGIEDAPDMLAAVESVVTWRARENAAHGWTGFTPTVSRPLLLVVIDECHEVFRTSAQGAAWAKIARKCRKVGVSLVCLSQYAGLDSFGGSEALRSSVMSGNAIAMYAPSRQQGQLIAGLEVDPMTLPKIAGYGYIMGTSVARTAPFRNRLISDPAGWFAAQPRPALDALSVKAAGAAYAARAGSVEEVRAATRAEIDAFLSGPGPDLTPAAPAEPAAGEFDVPTFPRFRLLPGGAAGAPEPEDSGRATAPGSAAVAVLDVLAAGPAGTAALVQATGYSESRVRQVLNRLMEDGQVTRPARGRYELSAQAS